MREFAQVLDDILNLLIARGQGIEINTAAPRYGLEGFHPHLSIVKRYRELGGTVITCGSDAHRKEYMASGIAEAYAMLKELGFSTVSIFEAGKEVKIPL